MNQYLTRWEDLLRRSVGLTTLAATLSWALLADAVGEKLLGGKPPHHGKVSFNREGDGVVLYCASKLRDIFPCWNFDDKMLERALSKKEQHFLFKWYFATLFAVKEVGGQQKRYVYF